MFKVLGNGSVAQNVLHGRERGKFLSINLAYGLGVTMAVLYSGQASGLFETEFLYSPTTK